MFNPEMETLAPDKLQALQQQRLQATLERVYHNVPFYKTMLDAKQLKPEQLRTETLHQLPFTYKDDLRQHYPFGLCAVPQEQLRRVHGSSGTTGKPTIVAYTANDIDLFAEVNARCLAAAGGKPGMLFHNAYGYGLFTGGLGLHYGAERLGMAVVPVSGGMTDRQLTLIHDLQPKLIACTPSYAQTLGEAFKEQGVTPEEISLEYGILGAEPWTNSIRNDVQASLGIRATNIYGLSEIIGPGVSNEDVLEQEGSYIWEDHFYPEIVDPNSGEPLPEGEAGVLVITTLSKEALPLLRYWTGDITTLTRQPGSSGRTHARMGMIMGRSDDMLIIRGVNVYPTQIEAALEGLEAVARHYQLVVRRERTMDTLELKLELAQETLASQGLERLHPDEVANHASLQPLQQEVSRRIKDRVGISVDVTLLAPGEVPRSAGGKLRRIVDERQLG